ncbi:MAG: MASE3 domain-containing protein [Elusimicrobiota bacterium]
MVTSGNRNNIEKYIFVVFILGGLYIIKLYNYLLFHTLAEFFSIVIAGGIFVLAWATKDIIEFKALIYLGVAYLFVGSIDLMHTLTYTGMGVIEGGGINLPTQLWIFARYFESITLLAFPFLLNREIRPVRLVLGGSLITGLGFMSIFYFENFPVSFVSGEGLTGFKIVSEYLISLILLISLFILWKKKDSIFPKIYKLMVFSITATVLSELSFTLYANPYGFFNAAGHFLKILSFYFIYRAVIETGISEPLNIMFSSLNKSRERLKNQKDRMLNIMENIHYEVYVVSKDYRIEYVNSAMVEGFGPPGDKKCYEYCFDRKSPCPWCKNEEVFNGEEVVWEYTYPEGKSYEFIETAVGNPDGTVSKLKISKDITKRKKAKELAEKKFKEKKEELKLVHKKLEEARRLADLGELAATVAHELRNPLATMKTAIYNLKNKTDKKTLLGHINRIKAKIRDSDQIIDNLLFYTKIKPPEFEPVNIEEVIDESLEVTRDKIFGKDIIFNKNYHLPENLKLKGDFLQLTELTINLLSNAVETLPESGGEIDITLFKEGRELVMNIKDNGPGIDRQDLDKVNNPFFTTKKTGTGLGLAICQQITDLHGASFEIKSKPDQGTTVEIRLPLTR